ncbi:MAG: hypothetical protein ABSH47_25280 [Bryobacteraceae bacterium]
MPTSLSQHPQLAIQYRNDLASLEFEAECAAAEFRHADLPPRERFQEIASSLIQLRGTWQTIQPPFRRRFERLLLPTGFVIDNTRTAELGGLFGLFGDPRNPTHL